MGNSTCYEIVVYLLSFSERHFTAFDQRHFTPDRHFAFEGVARYWHFVDVVWLALFVSVFGFRRSTLLQRPGKPTPSPGNSQLGRLPCSPL